MSLSSSSENCGVCIYMLCVIDSVNKFFLLHPVDTNHLLSASVPAIYFCSSNNIYILGFGMHERGFEPFFDWSASLECNFLMFFLRAHSQTTPTHTQKQIEIFHKYYVFGVTSTDWIGFWKLGSLGYRTFFVNVPRWRSHVQPQRSLLWHFWWKQIVINAILYETWARRRT